MSSAPFEYYMNNAFHTYCAKRSNSTQALRQYESEKCHYTICQSYLRRQIRALKKTNHLCFHQKHIEDNLLECLKVDETKMIKAYKMYEAAKRVENDAYKAYRGVMIISQPNPFYWLGE